MKRAALALAVASLVSSVALAHPVRVGRYSEIPYGIRPDHPRPTGAGGPRRNGRVPGRAPVVQPVRVWNARLSHRRPKGPAIAADGTLYFGTDGGLTALAPDGTERWTARIGTVPSSPSLTPSSDVAVVTRGGLVALITPAGVMRRSTDLGAPARGSPLVLDDGSILVGTIDRRIHRLDANLRPVFVTTLADGTATTISLARRGTFAIATGRLLSLLDPRGALQRQVSLGGRATAPAAIADDGTIWVTTREGILLAIDPSGRVRSRTELGSTHYDSAAPAIGHDGAVRVPTMTAGIVCVGPTGTQRWAAAPSLGFQAPVSIDDDDTILVVERQHGSMLAIAADGTELWRVVLGAFSLEAPVLGADGTIYIATDQRGARVQAWRAPPAASGDGDGVGGRPTATGTSRSRAVRRPASPRF